MSRTIYLKNGRILLQSCPNTYSRSLTIQDGRVCEINGSAPDGAYVVDLHGRFAMPGFVDSHLHLVQGASGMGEVDLREIHSKEEFQKALLDAYKNKATGDWLVGSGWTQEKLGGSPDSSWFPNDVDIPMLCYRVDFHSAVLNDEALSALPLDRIESMTGGSCIRKGIVKEDALYEGVCPLMPEVLVNVKRAKTMQVLKTMQAKGITLIGSMEDNCDVIVLDMLELSQNMRIRVMVLDLPTCSVLQDCRSYDNEFLKVYGFKAFIDGSLGSRTAKMYDSWEDCDGSGVWAGLAAKKQLRSWVDDVARAGFAPVMHAIGDEAVGEALAAIATVVEEKLPRIEHAQFIDDRDIGKIKGVMFGVQPLHQPGDAAIAPQAVGAKRVQHLHNWRRMLDAGARLSFGSDWPVADADPIAAMQVAINNGLTVDEALVASTRQAAESLGEPLSGVLTVGSNGDVAILDCNPFEIDWKVSRPSVTMTILAGNIVYEKEEV